MFVIEKQPIEETTFSLDLAGLREILAGESISAVNVTVATFDGVAVPGIWVSNSIVGTTVRIRIRGGISGVQYRLSARITTNMAHVREVDVIIVVQDR